MTLISINGNQLDPLAQSRQLRDLGLQAENASKSDYILIQAGPDRLSENQRRVLKDLGVDIKEYVSKDTYLCSYKGVDLTEIRSLDFVFWANTYLEQFVVQSCLKSNPPRSQPISAFTATPKTSRLQLVDIIMHHDVDATDDAVKAAVARAARADLKSLKASARSIRIHLQQQYLDDVAAIDAVYLIQQVHPFVLWNNKAWEILDCDTTNMSVHVSEYLGEGQVVAAADTGFDIGKTDDTHPAFTGRVKHLYALGRPNATDDPDGHGTHVAGSILGDGDSPSMGGKITAAAPKAQLVIQSVLDSSNGLGGIPSDLSELFIVPYEEHGARIHTNSWGSSSLFGQIPYDVSASQVDKFIWEHPDMLILFAAGNEGSDRNFDGVIDLSQIGSQAAAKNILTVGASENNRPDIGVQYGFRWPSSPFRTDLMADNPAGMAAFSSRGPTVEGRCKPDVVAPGTAVLSSLSRNAQADSQYGESLDPQWWFLAGTSMATPLVAGCAAVVRESLVKNGTPNPSAALVKALLINGAVELVGQYDPSEAGPSPNNNSGFGLVNLRNSIILPNQEDGGFYEGGPLEQGQGLDKPITVNIPPGTSAEGSVLKVTLVWSDPPGAELQNDLDLLVRTANGQERHGNMGEETDFDRVNNVEQVTWTNIPDGEAQIIVSAFRITRDDAPQPYAVVWSINRLLKPTAAGGDKAS
ncbi:kp-43 peptidase/serine peptidase [Blastomyces gilchristii SLH14081]|uniref:Kp-43 peptidase/serine peptidase n=1 Tax=Blastomyces gilchristii (strain SLH14081) TaxID=559298 RepID=A0A179UCI5_BLAGS|nr:kp-43 peptidase/serine peptidase [Blastomyces gilchristii SLH14081]OAT04998.1 kp-43 peptidase/serine peptidase [Blastomyces gilchristii SLH14081]